MCSFSFPFRVGELVEFIGDTRVTGHVVGFGTVDNHADPGADDDHVYPVVIVKLNEPVSSFGQLMFHAPFVPSVLRLR